MTDGPIGTPNGQLSTVELISGSISEFGCLIYDLVESGENVVSKLHLGNGRSSRSCSANRKSSDSLLWQGRVENAISSILLVKTHRAAENASKFDILTKKKRTFVCFHGNVERLNNGWPKVELFEVLRVFETEICNVERVGEVVFFELILEKRHLSGWVRFGQRLHHFARRLHRASIKGVKQWFGKHLWFCSSWFQLICLRVCVWGLGEWFGFWEDCYYSIV